MAVARIWVALVLAAAALSAAAQHGGEAMHRRFDGAEKWSKVFDDPARDEWQKPAQVIAALKLPADATVADIGSGTGYFAVRIAKAVPRGRVYGADLEPDMVRFLNARAAREGLPNLASHVASADDPKLPAPVDLALVVDTYHHIADRSRYFARLKKSLKPGGRVAIVDFRLDAPVGPPRQHRIAPAQVRAEMERAGYRLQEDPEIMPYQYLLLFSVKS